MCCSVKNIHLHENVPDLSKEERARIWIHEHPTTIKILKIAALLIGIGVLASLPFSAPILGVAFTVGAAITGALLVLSASVALATLDILVPPHHDMKNHVYKPGQCEGGKLFYDGDVPILSLDSDDPFKAGKAHGYLCGDGINRLMKRLDFAFHTLLSQPRAIELPNTLAAIRKQIPLPFLQEIEGVVEGYNKWAQEQSWWQSPKKITSDELLLVHLMPDSLHFDLEGFEQHKKRINDLVISKAPNQRAVACSAIVDRDAEGRFVFARNMDWPSFGLAGAYSLVIQRKHTNSKLNNTMEIGVPGFVGTLTGMNSQGLAIAMNVCIDNRSHEMRGMPAAFYNRTCLEQCRNVNEIETYIRDHSPLGPYHLTAVDREKAKSIHFYQSQYGTHVIRPWKENEPLTTLNFNYTPEPLLDIHDSQKRQQILNSFFQHRQDKPLEEALSLPYVNNWITTHRVVMEPNKQRFRVAFDNAFAGKAPLQDVSTENLFVQNTP